MLSPDRVIKETSLLSTWYIAMYCYSFIRTEGLNSFEMDLFQYFESQIYVC